MHEIDFSNKRANMAYVGETPWHGLGSLLPADADIETWRQAAGLAWDVEEMPVLYLDKFSAQPHAFESQKRNVAVPDDASYLTRSFANWCKRLAPKHAQTIESAR